MTALDQVRDGDLRGVREAMRGLPEGERRRLAPAAIALLRAVRDAKVGVAMQTAWPYPGEMDRVLRSAQVLALATVTPAELRKIGPWALAPDELAVETLLDRSIPVSEFVEAIADQQPGRWNTSFWLMRDLLRASGTAAPAHPGYLLAMITGLESRHGNVYDALKADPTLLENEFWRLFEIEGGGETSLAAHDKYTPEKRSWMWALTQLCSEGLVARHRLLDASLAALGRDFAPFRASWFARFHEQLQPTPDERLEHVCDYLSLISSPVPATVSFTIRALQLAGGVSAEAVDLLRPALLAKATGTVKLAIKLLPRSPRGGLLAADALAHASRESQAELLAFIESLGLMEPSLAEVLASAAPNVAPSLGDRLQRLLGTPARPQPAQPGADASPVRDSTVLDGPVDSVAELVELLARVLERIDHAHDLERTLEGVSRLCDRSEDTLRRLEPVARRARKVLVSLRMQPFAGTSPRADVAGLVIAWASGETPPRPVSRASVLGFLSDRVGEVAARAAGGVRQPILALPTAPGGAIDPAVLAVRRDEHRRLRIQPGPSDAIQAALRGGERLPSAGFRFVYGSEVEQHTYQGKTYTHIWFRLRLEPPFTHQPTLHDVPGLFLAALTNAKADYAGLDGPSSPAAVRWVATAWPTNREPYYARGALELGQNIDWWEARWRTRHFLEPLLLPTEPIGEMGRLLLALGLGAKEPGERTLATDVLVAAIGEHRVDAAELGHTLGRLYDERVVKGARIAAALTDAARVSTQHADAISTVIEHTLAGLRPGTAPADLHPLLGALSDLLAGAGRGLGLAGASVYLASLQGSGKAASLARSLVRAGEPSSDMQTSLTER